MRCTDLPRTIERQGQSGNIHIPANSKVYVNFPALHTNPAKWGSDAMEFRPTRWLTEDSTLDKPKIITYDKAVVGYLAWSSGPRVCPGYKMSQARFAHTSIIYRKSTTNSGSRWSLSPLLRHCSSSTKRSQCASRVRRMSRHSRD